MMIRQFDGKEWSQAVLDKYNNDWLLTKSELANGNNLYNEIENLQDITTIVDDERYFNGYKALNGAVTGIMHRDDDLIEALAYNGSLVHDAKTGITYSACHVIAKDTGEELYRKNLKGAYIMLTAKEIPESLIDYMNGKCFRRKEEMLKSIDEMKEVK